MAAAFRALNTTELLETILLQLPMKDIISAKSVSKRWRALIAGSVSLQRALYLVATPGQYPTIDLAAAARISDGSYIGDFMPPVQNNTFSVNPVFKAVKTHTFEWARTDSPYYYTTKRDAPGFVYRGSDSYDWRKYVFRWNLDPKDSAKLLTDAGAMPSMYLTQPPCTMVGLWVIHSGAAETNLISAILREEQGVTLGLIKETHERMTLRCGSDSPDWQPLQCFFGFRVKIEGDEVRVD